MGVSPEANKLRLIERIIQSDDPMMVERVLGFLDGQSADPEQLKALACPIREKLVIEDLIKEQNWTPIDKEKLMAKFADLEVDTPIEDLLEIC